MKNRTLHYFILNCRPERERAPQTRAHAALAHGGIACRQREQAEAPVRWIGALLLFQEYQCLITVSHNFRQSVISETLHDFKVKILHHVALQVRKVIYSLPILIVVDVDFLRYV
jgi:hypothetical protein